jgi:hypothetical protein
MDGTDTYDVCIVFTMHAKDDDTALSKVTEILEHNTSYDWAWIYTTQTNKEIESNDRNK